MDREKVVLLVEKLFEDNLEQSLSDIQELVLSECFLGESYQQIADRYGYDHDYVKQIGAKLWRSLSQILNRKVNKSNLQRMLRQHAGIEAQPRNKLKREKSKNAVKQTLVDWGDAIDVDRFVGRGVELKQCQKWIVEDRVRLINILGMGGVGKTAIASRLARNIVGEFDYVIWRSLRNAPPLADILPELILFVSEQQSVNLYNSIDSCIECLMKYLATSRCLLVLDNVESILRQQSTGGRYKEGYEGYGQLLRRLADEPHQSCLVITSRELPIGLASRTKAKVRSQSLSGLSITAAKEILKSYEIKESQRLIEQYAGNPLALKIAATTISSLFRGNVTEFLATGTSVFGDIWNLLEQQFDRLSKLEQTVMYWLAINREAVTLSQLRQDVIPTIDLRRLLEVLESLQRRSLIEISEAGFSQQPVVMEYVTAKIIEIWQTEIGRGEVTLLQTHPMIKAQDKDYLREAQVRLILQPIALDLLTKLEDKPKIEKQLGDILSQLRVNNSSKAGYAIGNIINLLKFLEIDLTGYDFSGFQVWQADLRKVSLPEVNFANADLNKSVFTEKMGSIFAVEFSPHHSTNGNLLATGDDRRIKIWQMPEGKHIMTLAGHDAAPIWTLAFSPDGQTLASGGSDRKVRFWDIVTGKCFKTLSGHQGSVWSVAFSPDGKTLASTSEDDSLKLWQIETEAEIATLPCVNPPVVNALAYRPDGNLVAASNQTEGIKIWQLDTLTCIQTIPVDTKQNIPLAYSPDGQFLAVGLTEGTIAFWNLTKQTWQQSSIGHSARLTNLVFSRDGKTLASSSADRTIRVWQFPEGKCKRVLQGHQSRISSISIASDDLTLASGSEDGSVRLWNLQTGQCLKVLSGYSDRVWSVAFGSDGQIASANEPGVVRLWNTNTGNYHELKHKGRAKSVAFTPDGKTLASVDYNYQIKIWNLTNRQCIRTIQGSGDICWSVAFSADGQTIATCAADDLVYCWDIATGNLGNVLSGHQSMPSGAVFLSGIYDLATASLDKTVKLWSLKTGKCVKTLQHQGAVWSIAYDPQSNVIATGIEDGSIKLWNLNTGECFATLMGHAQTTFSVAFNADGSLLASGSADRAIAIWDMATKQRLKTISAHQDSVFSVAFSPDANILASGSHDETVKLWDVGLGDCLQTFQAPNLYEGMNIKGATGLTKVQKEVLKTLGSTD